VKQQLLPAWPIELEIVDGGVSLKQQRLYEEEATVVIAPMHYDAVIKFLQQAAQEGAQRGQA
jgi:hypothetical protein